MPLPIGELLENTTPAPRPARVTLPGRYCRLVPLDAAEHAKDLWTAGLNDPANDDLWLYLGDGPYREFEAFEAAVAKKAASEDPLFFAILCPDGRGIGWCSLMRIDPANRVIEVGHILFTPLLQRTPAATEAIYLAARYVFEDLGYRRYEWKCNNCNEPSKRAAVRYGFTYEGLFRQHLILKGRNRDTAWFSMLDSEWPARKAAFEAWLAPENFDAEGRQVRPLARSH
jgi:RimJ/RimL family protein N-acetyltransferase